MAVKLSDVLSVSQSELAALLDITAARVSQLTTEGVCIKAPKGGYRLHESVRNYIGRLRKGDSKSADAKERLMLARAELAEMEAKVRSGELIQVADVERHWTDLMLNFRQRMLSLPHRAAPMAAADSDVKSVHALIEGLVNEALQELETSEIDLHRSATAAGDETRGRRRKAAAAPENLGVG